MAQELGEHEDGLVAVGVQLEPQQLVAPCEREDVGGPWTTTPPREHGAVGPGRFADLSGGGPLVVVDETQLRADGPLTLDIGWEPRAMTPGR